MSDCCHNAAEAAYANGYEAGRESAREEIATLRAQLDEAKQTILGYDVSVELLKEERNNARDEYGKLANACLNRECEGAKWVRRIVVANLEHDRNMLNKDVRKLVVELRPLREQAADMREALTKIRKWTSDRVQRAADREEAVRKEKGHHDIKTREAVAVLHDLVGFSMNIRAWCDRALGDAPASTPGTALRQASLEEDARLWRALVSLQRIRIMGGTNDGNHIGVEFWHKHPDEAPKFSSLNRFINFLTRS